MPSLDEVFLVTLGVLLFISCGVTGGARGGECKAKSIAVHLSTTSLRDKAHKCTEGYNRII